MMGVQSYLGQFGAIHADRARRRRLREMIDETAIPYMVIDPRPGLHIIDVTDTYAASTLTRRHDIAGDRLFDTFPDNPGDPGADGVSNLYGSIQKAAQTGRPHAMAVQRYDVRDEAGNFIERYWRPINIPVFDDNECLLYILHDAGELTPEDLHPAALRAHRQRAAEF
jgi:hypothetical protein